MLTRLRIRNFKAWADTGDIRLAPLTVFFGTNSSGKSSIGQLLLLLKQTAESQDRTRVLNMGGDPASYVDLGDFESLVHRHDRTKPLGVGLEWPIRGPVEVPDDVARPDQDCTLAFDLSVAGAARLTGKLRGAHRVLPEPIVQRMTYSMPGGKIAAVRAGMHTTSTSGDYALTVEPDVLLRRRGKLVPFGRPTRFYGFPAEVLGSYQNSGMLGDLALELERALTQVHYLGPLREHPQRVYRLSGQAPEHVGGRGADTVAALVAATRRELSRGGRSHYSPFHAVIARHLKEMGLISSFEVRPIAKGRKEYEVVIQVRPESQPVVVTDVGFGVSQVLPVLVECFYVPAHSTVILEQPEIHLHPSVQAHLADVLIEATRAKEDGRPRSVQLLVESHSEHFLYRLQRRIAEEKLSPNEVALYFCEQRGGKAVMRELEVDDYGNIMNWPDGFFGDEPGDLFAMTEAALRRRIEAGDA